MNDIKIFENPNFGQIRTVLKNNEPWFVAADVCREIPGKGPTPWHGYVYAIEYGSGIKIGHTTNLVQRINSIQRSAINYADIYVGRVVFSKPHTNHKENETLLHRHFKSARNGQSERFDISLDDFLNEIPQIQFLDESAKKAEKGNAFLSAMKNLVKRGEFVE